MELGKNWVATVDEASASYDPICPGAVAVEPSFFRGSLKFFSNINRKRNIFVSVR